MKSLAFLLAAGLISGPAFAVENEQPTSSAAPVAAEPTATPPVAEPAPSRAAQEPTTHDHATPATAAAEQPKPETRENARAGAAAPQAKDKDRKKPETAQKPALSKQAYARLLAAEIRRRTPKSSNDKTGSIHVAFTVGASGRVVSHKVKNASNPALEPVVGQILASVQTPPPPGGSFSAVQEFNFH